MNERVEALTRAVFSELDISHPTPPTVAALGQVIERHLAYPGVPLGSLDLSRAILAESKNVRVGVGELVDRLDEAERDRDAARSELAQVEAEALRLRGLIRVVDRFVGDEVAAWAGAEANRQWREAADR